MHQQYRYGTASKAYAPIVSQLIERMEVTELLDYGCGASCNLAQSLKLKSKLQYQAYDPGVPRFAAAPLPSQLVCCIDVLEHVEPVCLEAVLDDLCRLTLAVAFITVFTGPALKELPDGRNAHLIQQPLEWWLPKLWARFELQTVQKVAECEFFVIGLAKPHLEGADGAPLVGH